jgi:hypothetical protein
MCLAEVSRYGRSAASHQVDSFELVDEIEFEALRPGVVTVAFMAYRAAHFRVSEQTRRSQIPPPRTLPLTSAEVRRSSAAMTSPVEANSQRVQTLSLGCLWHDHVPSLISCTTPRHERQLRLRTRRTRSKDSRVFDSHGLPRRGIPSSRYRVHASWHG